MGKRVLWIDGELFTNFFKQPRPGEMFRRYQVTQNPLPADARIVGYEMAHMPSAIIGLIIQSDEWFGDLRAPLDPPEVRVYYLDHAADGQSGSADSSSDPSSDLANGQP